MPEPFVAASSRAFPLLLRKRPLACASSSPEGLALDHFCRCDRKWCNSILGPGVDDAKKGSKPISRTPLQTIPAWRSWLTWQIVTSTSIHEKPRSACVPAIEQISGVDGSTGNGWLLSVQIKHGGVILDGLAVARDALAAWQEKHSAWEFFDAQPIISPDAAR